MPIIMIMIPINMIRILTDRIMSKMAIDMIMVSIRKHRPDMTRIPIGIMMLIIMIILTEMMMCLTQKVLM